MAASGLRKAVSKNKRRFRCDGFDLDLSFVTERIIAMGFPAEHFEGIYRNPMDEVVRFLDSRHRDHYKVYNLCDNRSYDAGKFHGRVACYPFTDHQPPTVDLLRPFCEDVQDWLDRDPHNVVAIHCKAGKGRTGVMICAYLLFARVFTEPAAALEFYGSQRTLDMNGVTIPSQRRYVDYFGKLLNSGASYHPVPMLLKSLHFECSPNLDNLVNYFPSFSVTCGGVKVYKAPTAWEVGKGARLLSMHLAERLQVVEDVRVDVYNRPPFRKKEKMFHFWFNTFFLCPPALASSSHNGLPRHQQHGFHSVDGSSGPASSSDSDGGEDADEPPSRRKRPSVRPSLPPFSLGPPIHTLEIPKSALDKANKDKTFPEHFKVHIFLECLGGSSPKTSGAPNGGLARSPGLASPPTAAKAPPPEPARQRRSSGSNKMERVKSFSGDSISSRVVGAASASAASTSAAASARTSTSSGALLDAGLSGARSRARNSVDMGQASGPIIHSPTAKEGPGAAVASGSGGPRNWSESDDEEEEGSPSEESEDEAAVPVVRSGSKTDVAGPAASSLVDSLVPLSLSARVRRKSKNKHAPAARPPDEPGPRGSLPS